MYEVVVLKEGYNIKEGPGIQKACGSITLVKGRRNVIVDTGNPWDKDNILEELHRTGLSPSDIHYVVCTCSHSDKAGNLNVFDNAVCIMAGLKKHNLTPDKIEFVVCTHGHSDHVGNLNLFANAIHIVSHDICVGDTYMLHDFEKGIPYEIDDDIEVVSTPGHTGSDVSVIVKNTKHGTVAVTGDLFERLEDLEDFTLWQENSENPEAQQHNRMEVLKYADKIVPGHGPMFEVPNEYKQQLKMVMYYEHSTVEDGPSGSKTVSESSYTIIEEN